MPKFKVLVNGRFGEGWEKGEVVIMDDNAAKVPLEEGAIEPYEEEKPKKKPGRKPKKP